MFEVYDKNYKIGKMGLVGAFWLRRKEEYKRRGVEDHTRTKHAAKTLILKNDEEEGKRSSG